ncbi:hypothetical protein [Siccirubricoccus phaeus]|uniref:hypothetical protein n=1 Tax=Siccirubricoccus phaeus TaxID=2595053 RepID=UPI0011F0DA88|nr:hypothetical protein [Siccirubricoccus phaeus]
MIGDAGSDSPTEFRTKLDATREFTQLATARLYWMRSRGIEPSMQNLEAHPLSDIRAIINSRGEELSRGLEAQGVPRDQIPQRVTAALTQEFGIRPSGGR